MKRLAVAEAANPSLAQSISAAAASQADVAAAGSGRLPSIGLQGSVGYIGPVAPFHRRAYDPEAVAEVTLTQPLIAGGLIASQIRQAKDRNEADRQAVSAADRQAIQFVATAWNQMTSGQTETRANEAQVQSAVTALKGYQVEYGYGLRSTLDVLIADQNLRAAQVSLAESRHDTIVAQAGVLAAVGRLEARFLLAGEKLYDPQASFQRVKHAGAVPWKMRSPPLDNIGAPRPAHSTP